MYDFSGKEYNMEKVIEYIVGVTMLIILFIVALISSDYDSAITVMFFLLIMLLGMRKFLSEQGIC